MLAAIYSNCVSRHAAHFTLYSCHGDSMVSLASTKNQVVSLSSTKNRVAGSVGLNRFPIRSATFARSATHA